ncbi:FKBP-type peptidyl-prolyl cis-trans isomerase [Sphingomonas sp. RB3P16]|uniref:FKBP-type peptidyl-prolyl cis-trans isomerase n=1 Tax=Parasphingomonas frigoris TaxID=3096163 RepID=UPI002FC91976
MSITAVPLKPVKRGILVYVWIGVAVAVLAAIVLAFQTPVDPAARFLARNARAAGIVTTPSGLQYQVLKPGTGAAPTDDDVALVNYEGRLLDGTVFDKSQQPTPMPIAGVVPGFSEALKLMPKGAKYRIWLKPALAYGDKSPPGIPANSTLVFDVEMLEFIPMATYRQIQQQQQMMMQQGGGAGGMPPGAAPGAAPGADGPPTGR